MASQATITEFSRSVDPAVNTVFNGNFKQVPTTYKDVASVSKTDIFTTEMTTNVGASMASERTEQASLTFEAFLQGDGKNLPQFEVAHGVQVSKHLWKFQRLNQIRSLVANTAQAVARRREFDTTKLLERGFDTSYTHEVDGSTKISLTGGDSLALFSASHATTRSSTAQTNIIGDGNTVNMDLAEDALEGAETIIAPDIDDNSDQVIAYNLDMLLVPRSLTWVAQRLLQSTGRVGTNNNDVNLLKGRYKLVTLPFHSISSTFSTAFYLKDSSMNNMEGFVSYIESQPVMRDEGSPFVDFDTKSIKWSWSLMYTLGHNNYQSVLGSKGKNVA